MVRRHVRSEFAADVFVFPGGKVDPGDTDTGLSPYVRTDSVPAAPGVPDEWRWRALEIAAIRELFEEAGVLLAYSGDGEIVSLQEGAQERFEAHRESIHSGQMTMLDLALNEQLYIAADRLQPFSHWITPAEFPRRFDTWFFVADLPMGQEPLHDRQETTDGVWIAPGKALQHYREGEFPLVFATEKQLERMARFGTVQEMLAATTPRDLEPVMPRAIETDVGIAYVIPGDPGYDET
jgi:8-oxo-dGTP pyrophosphatase MutT (NUDIX family)